MRCEHHEQLHVVVAVANPIQWESRIRLFRNFERHMLESGVCLTVVECAFGDRPHELACPGINHIPVRADGRALIWNKECLLNLGIQRLPPEAKYIATLDADIRFRRADWAAATIQALQHYDVVQPWMDCYDLGPDGQHMELHRSFAWLYWHKQPIIQGPKAAGAPYKFGHPGFAWAWRRDALEATGGLIETAALGAADHHMALALIGRVDDSIPGGMTAGYVHPLRLWQLRAKALQGNLGYLPGTIEHEFHGAKPKRNYVGRWETLIRAKFDPLTDLRRNTHGVIELAPGKPDLRHEVDRYFRARFEDANSID
jgi:hypothetical protein